MHASWKPGLVAPLAALVVLASARVAAAQSARPAAQRDPPPPSSSADVDVDARPPPDGIPLLISGSVFAGLAVVNVATMPICFALSSDLVSECIVASLIVAGVYVAIGVPMLLVGASQHAHVAAWHGDHPWTSVLDTVGVSAHAGGGALTLRVAF